MNFINSYLADNVRSVTDFAFLNCYSYLLRISRFLLITTYFLVEIFYLLVQKENSPVYLDKNVEQKNI